MKSTICTAGGRFIDLMNPTADDIDIYDICRALSRIARFNGHTLCEWSVAQHSLLVYDIVAASGTTPAEQLHALLHDAHEAYIGDMVSPLKAQIPEFKRFEKLFDKAIGERFNIDLSASRGIVKDADRLALEAESHLVRPPQARSGDFNKRIYDLAYARCWVERGRTVFDMYDVANKLFVANS